jgi:hypothetical protein
VAVVRWIERPTQQPDADASPVAKPWDRIQSVQGRTWPEPTTM